MLSTLYRLTGGVPRLINVICDRALLGAYVQGKDRVDGETLRTAAREVSGKRDYRWRGWSLSHGILASVLLVLCAILAMAYYAQRTGLLVKPAIKTAAEEPGTGAAVAAKAVATPEKSMTAIPDSTKEKAYGELFKIWQIEYKPEDGRPVCEQARAQGLRCMEGSGGSISGLRQTNKPAVLRFLDEKYGESYATLTALNGETGTCVIGNETKTFDAEEITRRWSGAYVLLWRVPSDYSGKLKQGRRGPLVGWLDRQLALVQGRAARPGREPEYDEEIVKQVKEFQRAAGLKPDGIAGPETLMVLTAAAGDGGPTLRDRKGSN
jgi:general secretion pathway protein A